jgi:outer membrane protein assembly factor BamA
MRSATLLLLIMLSLGMTACTTMVPREKLPSALTTAASGEQVKVVAIPLPVIASSPNEGITAGGLTAFLLHNKADEVTSLLAPQVNYNENFGATFSFYGAIYPAPGQSWEFNLSRSTNVNEDYEVRYITRDLLDKKLEINAFPYYFTDGSARFFGFQQSSTIDNETNYGDQELGFTLSAAYQIAKHYQIVVGDRIRKVNILQGAVSGIPYIGDVYTQAEVPGVNGFTTHAQKLALVYSTLDSPSMPTFGGYARISMESNLKIFGSSNNYRHFDVEMKGFIPFDNARYITAFRLAYNQVTSGNDIPFLEQSILGGETTLRGYGRNRFIDKCYLLFNLEERIRLFRWEIFNVDADWELAPFMDFGSVMRTLDRASTKSFEFNPGIGFRAIVRPNIVGRLDIGFGKDGPALFVGLGYPF